MNEDILAIFAEKGVTVAMLVWFMFRAEKRLEAIEKAIRDK